MEERKESPLRTRSLFRCLFDGIQWDKLLQLVMNLYSHSHFCGLAALARIVHVHTSIESTRRTQPSSAESGEGFHCKRFWMGPICSLWELRGESCGWLLCAKDGVWIMHCAESLSLGVNFQERCASPSLGMRVALWKLPHGSETKASNLRKESIRRLARCRLYGGNLGRTTRWSALTGALLCPHRWKERGSGLWRRTAAAMSSTVTLAGRPADTSPISSPRLWIWSGAGTYWSSFSLTQSHGWSWHLCGGWSPTSAATWATAATTRLTPRVSPTCTTFPPRSYFSSRPRRPSATATATSPRSVQRASSCSSSSRCWDPSWTPFSSAACSLRCRNRRSARRRWCSARTRWFRNGTGSCASCSAWGTCGTATWFPRRSGASSSR